MFTHLRQEKTESLYDVRQRMWLNSSGLGVEAVFPYQCSSSGSCFCLQNYRNCWEVFPFGFLFLFSRSSIPSRRNGPNSFVLSSLSQTSCCQHCSASRGRKLLLFPSAHGTQGSAGFLGIAPLVTVAPDPRCTLSNYLSNEWIYSVDSQQFSKKIPDRVDWHSEWNSSPALIISRFRMSRNRIALGTVVGYVFMSHVGIWVNCESHIGRHCDLTQRS